MGFNGDDAIALQKNDVNIDIIGEVGTDPGTNWSLDGKRATSEYTLVRKSTVSSPSIDWNESKLQWDVYPQDTSSYLGSHVFESSSFTDKQSVILDANEIVIPEMIKVEGDMSLPLTGSRGTTISWVSDTIEVISNEGIVTLPTPSPVNVILIATVTKGTVIKEVEFLVSVGLADSDRIALDRDAIVVQKVVTEAGNMDLPTNGVNGSTISWSSNTPATISDSGVIVLPDSGAVDVTLTATVAYGFSSTTKIYYNSFCRRCSS